MKNTILVIITLFCASVYIFSQQDLQRKAVDSEITKLNQLNAKIQLIIERQRPPLTNIISDLTSNNPEIAAKAYDELLRIGPTKKVYDTLMNFSKNKSGVASSTSTQILEIFEDASNSQYDECHGFLRQAIIERSISKLELCLLYNSNLSCKILAVESLLKLGDASVLPIVLQAFSRNSGFYAGGSEIHLLQYKLDKVLIFAMETLTGLSLPRQLLALDYDFPELLKKIEETNRIIEIMIEWCSKNPTKLKLID